MSERDGGDDGHDAELALSIVESFVVYGWCNCDHAKIEALPTDAEGNALPTVTEARAADVAEPKQESGVERWEVYPVPGEPWLHNIQMRAKGVVERRIENYSGSVVTAADHDRVVNELHAKINRQNYENAMLQSSCKTWQERAEAAEAEFAKLEAILKSSCEDEAEDDTAIREMLRPHLTPYEVDGDAWSVPSIPTVVESFVKAMANRVAALTKDADDFGRKLFQVSEAARTKIAALEQERDGLREALDGLLKESSYWTKQRLSQYGESYSPTEAESHALAALSQPKGGE